VPHRLRYRMLVREVIAVLEENGWHLERSKGSHGQYVSPDGRHQVTLTINHRSAVAASAVIKKLQAAFLDAALPPDPAEQSKKIDES